VVGKKVYSNINKRSKEAKMLKETSQKQTFFLLIYIFVGGKTEYASFAGGKPRLMSFIIKIQH
jgi:hypothetical protein